MDSGLEFPMRFLWLKQSKGENLKGAVSRPSLVCFVRFCQEIPQTCVSEENRFKWQNQNKSLIQSDKQPEINRLWYGISLEVFPIQTPISQYVLFFHDFCPSVPSFVFVALLKCLNFFFHTSLKLVTTLSCLILGFNPWHSSFYLSAIIVNN